MITAICDKCKISMTVGFVCKETYLKDDFRGKLNWGMQQSHEDRTKHLCYSCMCKVFLKEEKK